MAYLKNGKIIAVLTGDLVNSTGLQPHIEKKLLANLQQLLQPYKAEFYRGDGFQAYIEQPADALWIAMRCRAAAIGATAEEGPRADARVSIGIGPVLPVRGKLALAKGEAFLLSGRALDDIQKEAPRLVITVRQEMAAVGMQVIAGFTDAIFSEMTAKQAAVISRLLLGETQQKISERLGKSKSTVSQIVHSSGWPKLEKILGHYKSLVNLLT